MYNYIQPIVILHLSIGDLKASFINKTNFVKSLISLYFVEDNKLMKFSQKNKSQNMLEKNINKYFNIKNLENPKF